MLASDIDLSELDDLTQLFGITRSQAERLRIQARKALRAGLNPVMAPGSEAGSVRARQRPQEPVEEPAPLSTEEMAQQRARRIAEQSYGQRSHDVALLRGRIATLQRNCQHGYREWEGELELCRRTLEILEGTTV